MKRAFYLFIPLSIVLAFSCDKKEDTKNTCGSRVYYHDAERSYQTEVYGKATISFYDTLDALSVSNVLRDFRKLSYFIDGNLNAWIIVDIASNSCNESEEILEKVCQKDEVSDCNLWLITEDGQQRGFTAKFSCKFLHDSLEYKLSQLLEETSTQYLYELSGTHFIMADKYSNGDALDMANYFYETGYFEFAEPNYVLNIELRQ